MRKIIIMSSSLAILAGCTTPPPQIKVDQEPILVGVPIKERVAKSSQTVNEQLDLLNKVRAKKYVGTFEMVEHNNGLDARKGSSRTLPQAYSTIESQKAETSSQKEVQQSVNVNQEPAKLEAKVTTEKLATPAVLAYENPMNKKIKRIEWENNSANDLGAAFAKTLGYEFVVSGQKDANITLKIEDETVGSAIEKFKKEMKNKGTVLVVEKNKTFSIIYK